MNKEEAIASALSDTLLEATPEEGFTLTICKGDARCLNPGYKAVKIEHGCSACDTIIVHPGSRV